MQSSLEQSPPTSPKVSVIIPCYNHAHYLSYAVHSVLAQIFTDWEAIIVDDGSTDDSREVAAQFTDPRIHYIYQENRGLSAARNTGIRAAQGEYLCFLDADDEWYPSFLSRCAETLSLNRNPRIVGIYTSYVHIDESGQVLPQPGNGIVPPEELPTRLVAGNFFPPCVVMVQSDIVRDVGMFDTNLEGQGTEDKDLWFRITRQYTLLGIPEPLARYRVCPGSMSTNAARMHQNRMAVLKKHFGPDEGNPSQWSAEKRLAYSTGYRGSAFEHITQGEIDAGWALLLRGAHISPTLLLEIKTYYELVCLKQPRGYRGQVKGLDIAGIGEEILHKLDEKLLASGKPLINLHKPARARACLALSLLAEHSGDWSLARYYMMQAFFTDSSLLGLTKNIRQIAKLLAGRRLSAVLDSLLR